MSAFPAPRPDAARKRELAKLWCNMGWDQKARGDKAGYYYRSVRRGNRAFKVYVGRGPEADEAARQAEQRHQERQARREASNGDLARIAAAEELLHELQALADLVVSAVLTAAGYHRRRGEWRQRRHGGDQK